MNRVKNEFVADARRRTKNAYRPNTNTTIRNNYNEDGGGDGDNSDDDDKATRLENLIISDK